MGERPQRPLADIGADATVDGTLLATAAPPTTGRTAGPTFSGRTGLALQRELPPELDRSGLGERERDLVISRYRLLSRLGAGGMGMVYLAYDPSLDRKVAVKLLRPGGDDREPAVEAHARLHREAQALAKLSHPNVIAVHDVGTYDAGALYGRENDASEGVFVVMEYVEGVTLARWLTDRQRSWREVLTAYTAAGRGLAAAHAVGVIHRDFKPGNVLVRGDGRVLVFDFGLARAAGPGPQTPRAARDETESDVGWASLSSPLTQYGAFVGTPAYMAPEQRGGEDIDERSDQFSFCVALYEGLCGNRPFTGENVYAIEMAKVAGVIDPPRLRQRLPKGLLRAVLRGLSPDPKRRWPNLSALLTELETHRRRRRGRIVAAALAVGLLGAGLGALATTRAGACSDAAEALGDAWGEAPRERLRAAFSATGLAYAGDTADRVIDRLDDYRARWLAVHTDACLAANVRRTQSPALMDRRMACLQQRRDELGALLSVFDAADASTVEHAVAAVGALPPVEACADLEALERAGTVSPEPALALALADARQRHAMARAAVSASHYAAGRDLAREVLARADQLGDRRLRAAAGRTLGTALEHLSEHAAAEPILTAAYFDALAAGDDRLALDIAIDTASLIGDQRARPDEGRLWLRHVEALLDRLGQPGAVLSRYQDVCGSIASRDGDYPRAEAAYRAALATAELHGNEARRASALVNLASTIGVAGKFEESVALSRRALELHVARLGPAHPEVALVLTNLGGILVFLGDVAGAEAMQRRALQIWRASLPPRHQQLGYPLAALGDLAVQRASYDEARAYYDEARLVWEKHFGPDYPNSIVMYERIASVLMYQGALAPARALAERAVRALDAIASPDPAHLALALMTRAQIAGFEGDRASARSLAGRARTIVAAAFGPAHLYTLTAEIIELEQQVETGDPARALPALDALIATMRREHGDDTRWQVEALQLRAHARNLAGRQTEALADLERARPLAAREHLVGVLPLIDLTHAQVLWATDDRPGAHRLATAAADAHRRAGAKHYLAETERWLREHPL